MIKTSIALPQEARDWIAKDYPALTQSEFIRYAVAYTLHKNPRVDDLIAMRIVSRRDGRKSRVGT